jgi:carbonic anhydrase
MVMVKLRIAQVCIYIILITSHFFAAANVLAAVNDSSVTTDWGYKGNIGPAWWGQLSPDFALCASGKMQSPINIHHHVIPSANALKINYHPSAYTIIDDGSLEVAINQQHYLVNPGHTIQVDFAKEANESLIFANENYYLKELHFHSPSENHINHVAYPLEIHFVNQSDGGKLLVISVFVKSGQKNKAIQNIIDHLPKKPKQWSKVTADMISLQYLLPKKLDYYQFMGSLTTPPCTEGVQWLVLAKPIVASAAQFVKIRRAIGGDNARPIQKHNEREIYFATMGNTR